MLTNQLIFALRNGNIKIIPIQKRGIFKRAKNEEENQMY